MYIFHMVWILIIIQLKKRMDTMALHGVVHIYDVYALLIWYSNTKISMQN